MTPVARIAIALTLACLVLAPPLAGQSGAAQETRRLCDRQVTYDVVRPADVPAEIGRLSGVWKGSVVFAGGSEMCLAIIVQQVSSDGQVILDLTWNIGVGGREDMFNNIGLGEALNWRNKVENGRLRIDSGTKWNGRHYYYVLDLPTEGRPDVIEGRFMVDTHAEPIVLHREKGR